MAVRGPGESLVLGAPNVTVLSALATGEAGGRRKVKSYVELCCCSTLQQAGLVPLARCVQSLYAATVSCGGRWVGAKSPIASLYSGAAAETSLKGALCLTGVPFHSEENRERDREVDSKRIPVWDTLVKLLHFSWTVMITVIVAIIGHSCW